MRPIIQALRAVVLLASLFGIVSPAAVAQTYPSRPIKVIVPYPPGGNTDLVGRLFSLQMSEILASPIVIDNRGGVSGTVGVAAAARSEADGYTLLHATNSELAVMPAVQANPSYDPVKDLTPISTTCTFPFVLVTRKSMPVQTIDDLVALARKNRGTMTFASVGAGSANHLILEPFKTLFDIDVVHVPYKGGGPAANDLLGGHVDAAFATLSSILPLVQSGGLRALLVTSEARAPQLPDVPSAGELGFKDLMVANWNAFLAPAGTPPAIVEKLNGAIVKAGRVESMIEATRKAGAEVATSTPQAAASLLAADVARWSKIAREKAIRID
jgi:tripartite-type tricarboxylate transporter receptor subunit TctC